MDNAKLTEFIDHNRWLLNNGMISDATKNHLFMYGSILHKEVLAVELAVDAAKKLVLYQVFVPPTLLKKYKDFQQLRLSKGILSLWRLRRLLKKNGNLDFSSMINNFVKDYCGNGWSAEVSVLSYSGYMDGYSEKSDGQDINANFGDDPKPVA